MGYAGGEKLDPNYHDLGDQTETVQVDYDPKKISYSQLLDFFWEAHDPGSRVWSRQYMNAVFYHNETQRQLAEQSKAALEKKSGRTVRSKILPVNTFYMAEEYHQKYMLKGDSELSKEMTKIYPKSKDFINSTAVARLNGYVGGFGNKEQLGREIDSLGLSAHGRQRLEKQVLGTREPILFN